MGSIDQQKAELAAFFGNSLHESDEFRAGREYLMCADRLELGGEVYCRPCDVSSFDWENMKCPQGASLASEGRAFNNYCQSNQLPPDACGCDDVYERASEGPMAGYVKANQVYFGRGSIQLSWNYNYIRASVALTGAPQTFCQRPDLVATNEEYAWGAGLFYWMENIKNDQSCHQAVLLEEDFGRTLDIINGGLECPADDHGWHGKAVQLRLNRYCRAASAIGANTLLGLAGCYDMEKRMAQCLKEGTCNDCKIWEDKINLSKEVAAVAAIEPHADNEGGITSNGGKKKDKVHNISNGGKDKVHHNANGSGVSKQDKMKQKEQAKLEAQQKQQEAQAQAAANNNNSNKFDQKKAKEMAKLGLPWPAGQPKNEKQNVVQGNNKGGEADQVTDDTQVAVQSGPDTTTLAQGDSETSGYEPDDTGEDNSTPAPTPLPTPHLAEPTVAASVPIEEVDASITGLTAICTGSRCPVPPGTRIQFCRNADGFCGTGPQYCNAESIWTASCDSDALPVSNANDEDTVSASSTPGNFIDQQPQGRVVPPARTRRPTELPTTKAPTPVPTPNPTGSSVSSSTANQFAISSPTVHAKQGNMHNKKPAPSPSASSQFGVVSVSKAEPAAAASPSAASQFGNVSVAKTEPAGSQPQITPPRTKPAVNEPPSPPSPPSQLSAASQFATLSHSKGRGTNPVSTQLDTATRIKDNSKSTENELSSAAQFGSGTMTNWNNGKAEYPPSSAPIVAPEAENGATNSPTPRPSYLPTKKPTQISAVNMASAFMSAPKSNDDEVDDDDDDDFEEESGADLQQFFASEEGEGEATTYFTKIDDETYQFSPLDDVTVSRSLPRTNFGSEPAIVVDMLEGDAAIFRFDLSAVGDATIESATLRLTSWENDGTDHAGVYYIQPVTNGGWTEDSVTYDSNPKASAPLFAAVANRSKGSMNQFELDVTKAAANHIISFRILGTDRIRSEFSSKESIQMDNAPVFLVKLEQAASMPLEAAPGSGSVPQSKQESSSKEDETPPSWKPKPNPNEIDKTPTKSEDQPSDTMEAESTSSITTATAAPAAETTDAKSLSFSGKLAGFVWLDKNADGNHDAIEPGLRGIMVDLYDCSDGQWVDGMRTAAGGEYLFSELAEGQYYVMITPGADLGFSSGVNTDGRGDCVELSSSSTGQLSASVNAGIVQPVRESLPEMSSENADASSDLSHLSCSGKPCLEGVEYCRSKFNFCGIGEEYCNELSLWRFECGTPSPVSSPSASPTTASPTFIHDPDINCAGEPCDEGDGSWCRSEIGYCGSGPLYCNSDSVWVPECNGVATATPTAAVPIFKALVPTESPTASHEPTVSNAPTHKPTIPPMDGFSPFVRPTLPHIVTPKQTDIHVSPIGHKQSDASEDEDEQEPSIESDASSTDENEDREEPSEHSNYNNFEQEEPWYTRFSDVQPASRNVGAKAIPGMLCILLTTMILPIFI